MSHRLKKKKRKKKKEISLSFFSHMHNIFLMPTWVVFFSLPLSLTGGLHSSFRGCLSKHVSFSLIIKKTPSLCLLYILWLLLFLLQIGTFNLGWEGHHLGLSVVTWPGPTTDSTLLQKKGHLWILEFF